jgi:hypothetical protein
MPSVEFILPQSLEWLSLFFFSLDRPPRFQQTVNSNLMLIIPASIVIVAPMHFLSLFLDRSLSHFSNPFQNVDLPLTFKQIASPRTAILQWS